MTMKIIPATAGTKAVVILPGETKAIGANVIAWAIDDTRSTPPRPIIAPDLPDARVAVKFNESPQCFEWPATVHASTEAFAKYVA